jgi:hypothetical protein
VASVPSCGALSRSGPLEAGPGTPGISITNDRRRYEDVEERRGRRSGQVSHVDCRRCHDPVLLDPAKMERKADHVELRCPHCDAVVPIRVTDMDRPAPEGVWAIGCYAEESPSEPEPVGGFFRRHRHN